LVALTEACKLGNKKVVNIYTDSQYAFSTVHVFAQQWKNRGMVTSTGKSINHKDLTLALLDVIQLSAKVEICKCAAYTKNTDPVSKGNRKADEEAKKAAQLPAENLLSKEVTHIEIDHQVLCDTQKVAPQTE